MFERSLTVLWLLLLALPSAAMAKPAIPQSPIFPAFDMKDPLAEEKFAPEDFEAMKKGEVIVKARPFPKEWKGAHVMAAAMVKGNVKDIFSVVIDCDGQPSYTPRLEICKNTYPAGVSAANAVAFEQYQKLKFGFGFISREVTYTNNMFLIPPYVMGWTLKEGDIAASSGYWRVIPYEKDRQILLYNVYTDPGMAVPGWIQELLTKSDLPATVKAWRDHHESLRKAK
jgi:hypothetical protein